MWPLGPVICFHYQKIRQYLPMGTAGPAALDQHAPRACLVSPSLRGGAVSELQPSVCSSDRASLSSFLAIINGISYGENKANTGCLFTCAAVS